MDDDNLLAWCQAPPSQTGKRWKDDDRGCHHSSGLSVSECHCWYLCLFKVWTEVQTYSTYIFILHIVLKWTDNNFDNQWIVKSYFHSYKHVSLNMYWFQLVRCGDVGIKVQFILVLKLLELPNCQNLLLFHITLF